LSRWPTKLPPRRRPTTAEAVSEAIDDSGDEPERGPLRRCIVTRERLEKAGMIRFVLGPDRIVVPDLAARLPGRGFWLSARRDVVDTACTKGAFARATRGQVTVPPDLLPGLVAALERRIGDHIGLARRAGQAVGGFSKAREWLVAGRAALLVQASDGSVEERARLLGGRSVPVVTPLSGERLGGTFGREHAVHVALLAGRLADGLVIEAGRLAGLMAAPAPMGRQVATRRAAARRDDNRPATPAGQTNRNQADQ